MSSSICFLCHSEFEEDLESPDEVTLCPECTQAANEHEAVKQIIQRKMGDEFA